MEPWNWNKVEEKYHYLCNAPSDINEHLPTVRKYTEECDSVLELGVRWIVAAWAFIAGKPKHYVGMDLSHPSEFGADLEELKTSAIQNGIESFEFIQNNDLDPNVYNNLPNFDLVFIDTDHTYEQVKNELDIYHSKANKYIILHDTVSFRHGGFDGDEKGIWAAIMEFLYSHPEWELWESYTNNNGLTILKRK